MEGWPIDLFKHISAHFDDAVRPDSQKELVEGRMVQPTHRYAVADDGFTLRFRIGNYVGGIEQFTVAQAAECTLVSVGTKNTLTECALMKAAAGQRRHVLAARLCSYFHAAPMAGKDIGLGDVVYRHREGEVIGGVMD